MRSESDMAAEMKLRMQAARAETEAAEGEPGAGADLAEDEEAERDGELERYMNAPDEEEEEEEDPIDPAALERARERLATEVDLLSVLKSLRFSRLALRHLIPDESLRRRLKEQSSVVVLPLGKLEDADSAKSIPVAVERREEIQLGDRELIGADVSSSR